MKAKQFLIQVSIVSKKCNLFYLFFRFYTSDLTAQNINCLGVYKSVCQKITRDKEYGRIIAHRYIILLLELKFSAAPFQFFFFLAVKMFI